jgi:hypothetical protein
VAANKLTAPPLNRQANRSRGDLIYPVAWRTNSASAAVFMSYYSSANSAEAELIAIWAQYLGGWRFNRPDRHKALPFNKLDLSPLAINSVANATTTHEEPGDNQIVKELPFSNRLYKCTFCTIRLDTVAVGSRLAS